MKKERLGLLSLCLLILLIIVLRIHRNNLAKTAIFCHQFDESNATCVQNSKCEWKLISLGRITEYLCCPKNSETDYFEDITECSTIGFTD